MTKFTHLYSKRRNELKNLQCVVDVIIIVIITGFLYFLKKIIV